MTAMIAATAAPEPILAAHGLTMRFGGFVAVDRVDLAVPPGCFMSIIGPNGAGKTTLFNLLSGNLRPSAGDVLYKGRTITGLPPHRRTRLGLGRSFQITNLFPGLSARENVRLAVQAQSPQAMQPWRPARHYRHLAEQAEVILAQVRLADHADTPAYALSHGDQRKLEIGLLLALQADVLLLDEPTAGMANGEVPAIMEVIGQIKAAGQHTILFVEHKLDLVLSLSDRILVLNHGAVLMEGTPAEALADPAVQAAYLGGGHDAAN